MGRPKKNAIAVTTTATASVVKDTCYFCYESLPADIKAKQTKPPIRIKAFTDLCDNHQKSFLKPFSKEDQKLAIELVNQFGSTINPMTKIFLSNVSFLVEGKKQRDAAFAKRQEDIDAYVTEMNRAVQERVDKEEARRAELKKLGLLKEPTEDIGKQPRRRRAEKSNKNDKTKKLSEIAADVQAQMLREGLSPSELMNRVAGGSNDAIGISKAVQGDLPQDDSGKSGRRRKTKRT